VLSQVTFCNPAKLGDQGSNNWLVQYQGNISCESDKNNNNNNNLYYFYHTL